MFDLLPLALIALLGAISPGPDFVVITNYALVGSRSAALQASLGVASALLIHSACCSIGIALLIAQFEILLVLIQLAGCCYLIYLGSKMLLSSSEGFIKTTAPSRRAYFSGFITNVLNPKAFLFIMSIFSQSAIEKTNFFLQLPFILIICGTNLVWFSILSVLFTTPFFQDKFSKIKTNLMKGLGVILILLSILAFIKIFI